MGTHSPLAHPIYAHSVERRGLEERGELGDGRRKRLEFEEREGGIGGERGWAERRWGNWRREEGMGEERGGNWRIERRGAEQRARKYVRERKKGMIRSMHAFYNILVVSIG